MKKFLKNNWFKILAIGLLLGALWSHPYGYYQVLRWSIMVICGYSAYLSYEKKENAWAWIFGLIAILFNPIIPFYFERETWQTLDVITAIVVVVNIIKNK